MSQLSLIKTPPKPRVGLYTVGLKAYWSQFSGLRERLEGYGKFIESKIAPYGHIFNFGIVDDSTSGRQAGEYFNAHNVDIIFCHNATYVTSDSVLPVHAKSLAPVVVLNLQPAARVDYTKTTTGEWLANCACCSVPEISNVFNRAGVKFRAVNGLLGLEKSYEASVADEVTAHRPEAVRAWNEIVQYIKAAGVKRMLQEARFGFLGNNYSGMLDMYSDFAMIQAQTGIQVEILEMCDLDLRLKQVTDAERDATLEKVKGMFRISEDSESEPLARKPSEEQLTWSCMVAAAQERMVRECNLDALAYYYHGHVGNEYEQLQSGFIVGHSLLTARGIPCAGEGDLKTAIAMKICDTLGVGGSYCELIVMDYIDGTILMGHDGPFHIAIAGEKPILRGMGLYHGKKGSGVSVEAKVKTGPITTLGCTQTIDGKLKLIISEGEATNGPTLQIGNTQTPVKFALEPDAYMDKWFPEAPTHHFAMSIGHNARLFAKTADILEIPYVII